MLGIGGTPEQKIQRQLKRLKQVYAQPDYRRGAMDALFDMGTPEAYAALCRRFTVVCNSAYWDEEEKRWLVDAFVDLGDKVVASLKEFVLKDEHVNYPLRALERLLSAEAMTAFLLEALTSRSPEDHRSDRGKLELVDHLGTRDPNEQLVDAITPYLHDHSDDVICKSIEVFVTWQMRSVAGELFGLVYDDIMSARVQRCAAEAVVTLGLEAETDLEPLVDAVAEDYTIAGRTLERRRPQPE